MVELGGARTQASVALRKEETSLGLISVYRHEDGLFTDKAGNLAELPGGWRYW
jgi:hypothetical protein